MLLASKDTQDLRSFVAFAGSSGTIYGPAHLTKSSQRNPEVWEPHCPTQKYAFLGGPKVGPG